MKATASLLNRFFWLILTTLVLFFLLSTVAGATWGLPDFWHADERLYLVMPALEQRFGSISETIAYPSLPFFIMVAVGKFLSQVTTNEVVLMASIRSISAFLGALSIVLTSLIVLVAKKSRNAALIAALLLMVSSGFFVIAHHAIVDIYLTFFVTLSALLLIKFVDTRKKFWLYLAFFTIGLASSSKYNGASLLLAGTIVAILFGAGHWRDNPLRLLGRMFLAYSLALGGFFVGTPRALFNASTYLEQLPPFLARQRTYSGPELIGLVGQWSKAMDGLGFPLFLLFVLAIIWAVYQILNYAVTFLNQSRKGKASADMTLSDQRYYFVLLLTLFAFDLPILFSQFYPMRYLVPTYPILAALSGLMLDDLWRILHGSNNKMGIGLISLVVMAVISFSALRFVSVASAYSNDSRIIASNSLKDLIPPGTRIEHTEYAPHLPTEGRVVDIYPLMVFKFEEDIATHTGWNMGEEGIEQRKPDYLVVDRKTYAKFSDDHLCQLNATECMFFTRLLNGETNYKLLEKFEYHLPRYLPEVKTDFANIEILLYERQAQPLPTQEEITWKNTVDARLGESIRLHGYDVRQRNQNNLEVTLYWTTGARLAEKYKVFLHCLDRQGQIVAQDDTYPGGVTSSTEYWLRDETVADEHLLKLPYGYASEECQLQVGLYSPETGERLPVSVDGLPTKNNTIRLEYSS